MLEWRIGWNFAAGKINDAANRLRPSTLLVYTLSPILSGAVPVYSAAKLNVGGHVLRPGVTAHGGPRRDFAV
jgi:hypothetical protein